MEEEKVRCSSRLIGLLDFSFRDTNITQRGGKGQIPILSLSSLSFVFNDSILHRGILLR